MNSELCVPFYAHPLCAYEWKLLRQEPEKGHEHLRCGGTATGGSGRASWRRQHLSLQGSEDLAPGGDALPHPSSDSAHSSGGCASHQLQPRGARIAREGELCVAWWSPAHSGLVRQATQQGVSAPSKLPRPWGQAGSPRLEGKGPGPVLIQPQTFPSGLSIPALDYRVRGAPSTCSVRVRTQVSSGDLEMEETRALPSRALQPFGDTDKD